MKNKKELIFGISLLLLVLAGAGFISAAETSYCCEKLENDGPWCMNAPEDQCESTRSVCGEDENEACRKVPTSCEATSYCKLGTCINSQEGDCTENTPRTKCKGGIWKDKKPEEIPQCQLGCCLIGSQAAFVTQTRCSQLSSVYGLEINYRTDINNEFECIASATSDIEGACVFEKEYVRTCRRLTKKECREMEASSEKGTVSFHEGFLCSAEALEVDCGPSEKTTCAEGKDEVYFVDTCGNLANVYNSNKIYDSARSTPGSESSLYWTYIAGTNIPGRSGVQVEIDCTDTINSPSYAGSLTCGDCDYYLGSTCKKAERGENLNYGDYICKNLGCEYDINNDGNIKGNENDIQHGETWCGVFSEKREIGGISKIGVNTDGESEIEGEDKNLPGGRYFRMVCYNGEVTVEPCADFRQEICIESAIETTSFDGSASVFKTAACRVNKWQDCFSQNDSESCNNPVQRDCKWIETEEGVLETEKSTIAILGIGGGQKIKEVTSGRCLPKYTPGLNFWDVEEDAEAVCSLGNNQCVALKIRGSKELVGDVGIGKGLEYSGVCIDDKGKVKTSWKNEMKDICEAIGDCSGKVTEISDYESIDPEGGGLTKTR